MLTIVALLFVLRCLRLRDWRWAHAKPYNLLLALSAVAIGISAPISSAPLHALTMAFIWLRYPLFFIAMDVWILRDEKDIRYFAWFLAPILLLMGIDTAVQ